VTTSPPADWGGLTVWGALAGWDSFAPAWAYVLYFGLIADIGPVGASTVTFLIPPFGVLWALSSWASDCPGRICPAAV